MQITYLNPFSRDIKFGKEKFRERRGCPIQRPGHAISFRKGLKVLEHTIFHLTKVQFQTYSVFGMSNKLTWNLTDYLGLTKLRYLVSKFISLAYSWLIARSYSVFSITDNDVWQ